MEGRPIRILLAKPGLDGHDKGVKVLARFLRDAGMEVIYTGLHQTPEDVAQAAVAEDVDVVGLSYLSGAHLGLTQMVLDCLRAVGVHPPVLVGGNIPERDREALRAMGVAGVFPGGSEYEVIIDFIRKLVARETSRT